MMRTASSGRSLVAAALAIAGCNDPSAIHHGTDHAPGSESSAAGSEGDDDGSTGAGADATDDGGSSDTTNADTNAADSTTGAMECPPDQCDVDGECGPCDTSYWVGVDRAIATTPYGHRTAVSCHNCYTATLNGTLAALHQAQADGADLLELDLTDEAGQIIVEHDDGGGANGAPLADVLMDAALQAGDQLLNIEIKETAPTEAFIAGILDELVASGCVRAGRPAMLRAFVNDSRLENLLIAQSLLATPAYAELAPHVRLHALLTAGDGSSTQTLQTRIDENADRGFQAIEFQLTTKELLTGIHYAESLGLGTSVWTVPPELGDMHVGALRDEVDSITTEYPVESTRARIEADNARFYLDATEADARADAIDWLGTDAASSTAAELNVAGRPLGSAGAAAEALFGTSLQFVAAEARSLPLADIGGNEGAGVLIAALVRFDALAIADGTTMTVLGKANAGEYSLELFDPAGAGGTVLRFGVHVDGGYHYASLPTAQIASDRAHWIIGAYDGDGGVHLLVDHTAAGTTTSTAQGGITQNPAILQLGADPQDPDPPRFFFEGAIQTALVQAWP